MGKGRVKPIKHKGRFKPWSVGMINQGRPTFNRNSFTELGYTTRSKGLTIDEKLVDAFLSKKRGNALHTRINGTINPGMTDPKYLVAQKIKALREEIPEERNIIVRTDRNDKGEVTSILKLFFNDEDRVCFFIEENREAWWVRRSVPYMPLLKETARDRAFNAYGHHRITWQSIVHIEREYNALTQINPPGSSLTLPPAVPTPR